MRTTRKVLLALVLTLCVAAVLSVCAFAALNFETDLPTGVQNGEEGWIASKYGDIDKEDGWYMIGNSSKSYTATETDFPKVTYLEGGRFYWNKDNGKGVWLITGSLTGNSSEEAVNSTSSATTKFYGIASAFVDITNDTDNVFKKGFAGDKSADVKKYIEVSDAYPIWKRYISGGTAKQLWEEITVSKSNYNGYIKYKATLGYAEDADVTDTAHQDLLVDYAYKNLSTYKALKNSKENGAYYTMAWVWNQLTNAGYVFETIEFRCEIGKTSLNTFSTAGLVTQLIEVKSVLMDSKVCNLRLTNVSRGMFIGVSALKNFDHVTFDENGKYDPNTVAKGVDLSGFTGFTPHTNDGNNAEYAFSHILSSSGVEKVVWFNTMIARNNLEGAMGNNFSKYTGTCTIVKGDEYAGHISNSDFESCTSLQEITLTAPLTAIKANAFKNCTALTTINLNGGVAEGVEIAATAFTNVKQEITVYVKTAIDEVKAKVAFAEFDNIKVINESPLKNPIIAEGFQIRVHNYSGLRSLFTLDASVVGENKGYSLTDYGTITFTEATLLKLYNNNLGVLLVDALSEDPTEPDKTIKTSVMEANRFVEVFEEGKTDYMYAKEVGDKTFCVTLTNIPDKHVVDAVYSVAYTIWKGENGTDYTFTIYESKNEDTLGKQAYSLYDVTIAMFVNGVVNTETVTDEYGNVWQCCLWDVLDNGAVPYEGNIDSKNKTNPANYDNPSHYLNNPLYAFSNYDYLWGPNCDNPILEETSTTNVTWSILKYNGKYIAVYRDAGGEGPSLLPGIWYEWKAGTHPFNSKYIHETAKTPTVRWSVYENIKTLVIDYGVEGVAITGDVALGAMPHVTTIVYPNGFNKINYYRRDWGQDTYDVDGDGNKTEYMFDVGYKDDKTGEIVNALDGKLDNGHINKCIENLFYDNSKLTDVIWANNDGIPHMKDFVIAKGDEPMNHLYDLRGMGSFSSNGKGTFSGCKLMENVVFGGIPGREIYSAVFTPATNLKRAWYELEHAPGTIYEAPLMKTIDIGRLKGTWGNLEGNVFGLKSNGYTIVLHQKIAEGAAYTYGLNKDGNMVDTFFGGNTELTVKIIVVDGDRNIIDPSAAATKLTTQIKNNTDYTNRVYFYYPDTDTYKNPAGTAFAG